MTRALGVLSATAGGQDDIPLGDSGCIDGRFRPPEGCAGETSPQARQLATDDRYLHHIWKPLLHEVAAGALGMRSKPVQRHVKLH
jgi:hypothetical protein